MRELSQEEIDQVSAGPSSPYAPVVAIPTTHHIAANNPVFPAPGFSTSFVPLADRMPA